MPKVSVIMGVFNGSKRIEKSVKSILMQSFIDFELIICDDCSTDDSLIILENIASKDTRVKILKNSINMKLAYTLNRCLEIATGKYIARMDDDDYSLTDRLEKQVKYLDSNLEVDIVGSLAFLFDEKGLYGKRGTPGHISISNILKGNSFIHPTVMIRKSELDKVGGYTDTKETLRTEDLDLWYKLYSNGNKGYVIDEYLLHYYESISSMSKRKYKYRVNEYKIRRRIRKHFRLSFFLIVYVYKPILVGLLPNSIIKKLHSGSRKKKEN